MKTTKAKLEANQEKTEPSQGMKSQMDAFISWTDICQARTESTQDEMEAKMNICQEKMEAAIHSIRSELEETIKHRMEAVLLCVDKQTQGLCKELTETIDKTQVG
jgi:hypothetical protein